MKPGARAPAASGTGKAGQSADAESTQGPRLQGVFPWETRTRNSDHPKHRESDQTTQTHCLVSRLTSHSNTMSWCKSSIFNHWPFLFCKGYVVIRFLMFAKAHSSWADSAQSITGPIWSTYSGICYLIQIDMFANATWHCEYTSAVSCLDGLNRQSLVFSERSQLSQAIPQCHVERILHRRTPIRAIRIAEQRTQGLREPNSVFLRLKITANER